MAKDRINVNPSELRSRGLSLISQGETYGKLAKQVKQNGDSVSQAWAGVDATVYQNRLNAFLGESEKYAAYVQDFGLAICGAASAYDNAYDTVTKKAGK